jgi:hypothetical protein
MRATKSPSGTSTEIAVEHDELLAVAAVNFAHGSDFDCGHVKLLRI